MNYTREQAEEVLKDYNSHFGLKVYFTDRDNLFLDHKFPKKVSGWYKTKHYEKFLYYYDFENNNAYGFDLSGNWKTELDVDTYRSEYDYLATPQEVEQRLIEEAKRRGFVEGVKYKSVYDTESCWVFDGNYTPHEVEEGSLVCHRDQIMLRGKWAEIIEQPETELSRTIKKAEKIADKLEKLLSSQHS